MKDMFLVLFIAVVLAFGGMAVGTVFASTAKKPKDPDKKVRQLAEDLAVSITSAGTDMPADELVTYVVTVSRGIFGADYSPDP